MNYQSHGYPGVFLVDQGGGPECPPLPPPLPRSRQGHPGVLGVPEAPVVLGARPSMARPSTAWPSMAFLFLLVFLLAAAVGFGFYQMNKLQEELRFLRKDCLTVESSATNIITPGKQVAFPKPELNKVKIEIRPAAHLIGRIHTGGSQETLRWDSSVGRAFSEGGVLYREEDGALLVNRTGLYHVYSRVELFLRHCSAKRSYVHSVIVRRLGDKKPLVMMEGRRTHACSKWTQDGNAWTSDSYLAAALHLKEADRVLVNVSHPTALSHSYHGNFFGLYKI